MRGYFGPGPGRFYGRPYVYGRPPYPPIDRERFDGPPRHDWRYGSDRPREEFDAPRRYDRRERVERFEHDRPYADPREFDRSRGGRFDQDPRDEPGPYRRG